MGCQPSSLSKSNPQQSQGQIHGFRSVINNLSLVMSMLKEAEETMNLSRDHLYALGGRSLSKLAVLGSKITHCDLSSLLAAKQMTIHFKNSPPRRRILIVEDDDITSKLLAEKCRTHRFTSYSVKDGQEAISFLLSGVRCKKLDATYERLTHDQIESVLKKANTLLIDLVLPRLNGLQLLRLLDSLGLLDRMDVVAMSGKTLSVEQLDELNHYTTNIMQKPYHMHSSMLFD